MLPVPPAFLLNPAAFSGHLCCGLHLSGKADLNRQELANLLSPGFRLRNLATS